MEQDKLYLALSKGENFGWGVCSKYLKKETPKFYPDVAVWDFENDGEAFRKVEGTVFHALTGLDFRPISKIWGNKNFGYTFFENELNQASLENSKKFEKVIGGSKWNEKKMRALGIENAATLIQGIDPEIFFPIEENKSDELFVIFSGGKFELRKSQDLVLEALRIMQQKYENVILINAWYNMWPNSMDLFQYSKHIKFERKGKTWQEVMSRIYQLNGIDENRVITLDLVDNKKLRALYAKSDVALFPNRCEGGTNLVMMEYMACGKPVIASYTSGHKDVLDENHALLLKENKPFRIQDGEGNLWADWEEPSLDEIIAKLEFAYNNRDEMRRLGKRAGEFMKNYTWEKSAEQLVKIIFG